MNTGLGGDKDAVRLRSVALLRLKVMSGFVCDDPHNVQEAESDSVRKATLDWWDIVISTRLNDPRSASKVVVMERAINRI
jgi:hypothetical protein